VTVNPLVAASIDQPADPWAGIWIAEDIELIAQGVRHGSWIDGGLGVVGAGLDALALVSDPIGVLLQYGVSWIIEHVQPLSQALDWLAGDPGQIAGHAQTWRNVAVALAGQADELGTVVRRDVADWSGTAAAAYRDWTVQQQAAIAALGRAAETMAALTEGAGFLIAAVRVLVRDAIATCVSRLVVYAAEELASFGFATPLVVEQVMTTVAAWAAKIARLLRGLLASLRNLMPIIRRLGELIDELKKILNRLRARGRQPKAPKEPPKKIGGPKDFDPQELRGLTPAEVKARIPDDWVHNPSARGGGEVYADPANRGRQIRIMPGYPPGSRPDPMTWGPYAVVSQAGNPPVKVPLAGNPMV
jgi:hypothetical protein